MKTEQELNSMSLQELRAEADYAAANPEPVEETVFQRSVTDPDGVERVYHGDTPEDLIDAIVAGRSEHLPVVQAPVRERTPDEEFVRAQELASNPTKTFKEMAAEQFGVPVGEVKERLQRLAEYESSQAAEEYVNTHPDCYPHPTSGARIQAAMREGNIPVTVDNIAKTVNSLREKGLLVERPAEFDPFTATLQELKARTLGLPVQDTDLDF
jgi:hypothetical protein